MRRDYTVDGTIGQALKRAEERGAGSHWFGIRICVAVVLIVGAALMVLA